MNILYIANHLNIGGITSYLKTLAIGLKRKGHNVYLASSGGDLVSVFTKEGIIYLPVPIKTKQEVSPSVFLTAFKLSKAVKKYNIEIVHTHSRTTQMAGYLLKKFCGVRHIWTCHGFFKKRFFRKAYPCLGAKVIAISREVKNHLQEDFKVPEQNITVINNGIDTDKFRVQSAEYREQKKQEMGFAGKEVIGIIARLSDVKGHKYLIGAMKRVLEKFPQAKLLIVGEGKMKEELMLQVKDLGIGKSVCFHPEVEDTTGILAALDIFVMPSLKEGLGLALMEAMACGLAVVGSNIGGIRTLIQDGYSGLLVEPEASAALSQAIIALLEDPLKRASFGRNASGYIEENFSQSKMISATEKLYTECLAQKE